MVHLSKSIVLICSVAFLVGCTSLNVHSEGRKPSVYPGVREDCTQISGEWSGPFGPMLAVLNAFDMPFSFVVDTLYFPSDSIAVARYKQPDRAATIETDNFPH